MAFVAAGPVRPDGGTCPGVRFGRGSSFETWLVGSFHGNRGQALVGMRAFLTKHVLTWLLLAGAGNVAAQPPAGSRLPPDENNCAKCHGEPGIWDDDKLRLHVPCDALAEDVHFMRGVNCHDCHGGDPSSFDVPEAHSMEVPGDSEGVLAFRALPGEVKKACANCHADQQAGLHQGVHAKAGEKTEGGSTALMDCGKCHGEKTHGMLPVGDSRSPASRERRVLTCGGCHADELASLRASVHRHGQEKDENGSGKLLECFACHGDDVHGMLPADDSRSPMFLDHQVQTCGGCHEQDLKTYEKSVHGKGLYKSGLVVTAACSHCHGAHGIYYAADRRSTLHVSNVAATCAECHRSIEERLQASVHGRGNGPGGVMEKPAPGGKWKRKPSCTDCHQGHHLLDPALAPFRFQLANRCGNCHPDLSASYAMSLHGELTRLGYEPAARCSDCHGFHDILPVGDPQSRLAAGENRLATCSSEKCHVNAVENFSDFDPHANHKDPENYRLLYLVNQGLHGLFYFFFGFFVVHAFLWFVRSFAHTLQQGGHKTLITEQAVLIRFEPSHRIFYAGLLVSFLGLILTGLPLKYGSQQWAQSLARSMGGFESTSVWHRFFAVVAIFGCVLHLAWGVTIIARLRAEKTPWKTILFGPDSPIPTPRDFKVLFGMGRWFLGLGPRPVFERWAYWEKFDYWAVYLAAGVIGGSGLLLWYPNLFCRVLPGEALNVAKMIHAEMAVLAASFLFIFHFYHSHFRPEKFPLDLSALTGLVSEEHLRKHRPEYVERLRRAGKLDELRRTAPSQRRLWLVFLAGSLVYSLGLCLLAVVLLATLGK